MYSLKILVDEMLDGIDLSLRAKGYEAYSVRKLQDKGEKIHSDYSILKRAEIEKMVLVTEDDDNIKGCRENNIHFVRHGQNGKIEDLLLELEKLCSATDDTV
jgi:uncharacterized protein with PIN domain